MTLPVKGDVGHFVRNGVENSSCYTRGTSLCVHLGKGKQNPMSYTKEQFIHKATRKPVNSWQTKHCKYPAYLF